MSPPGLPNRRHLPRSGVGVTQSKRCGARSKRFAHGSPGPDRGEAGRGPETNALRSHPEIARLSAEPLAHARQPSTPTTVLEEIDDDPRGDDPRSEDEARARRRLLAGLLVETGLTDKKVAKRWQAAVVAGDWDADACATEVLAAAPLEAYSSPAFLERAARIERDLVMASHTRGMKAAGRRVRAATRNSTAFIVANIVAFLVYSAVAAALLLVARIGYGWSIDGVIDRIAAAVRPG